MKKILFVEPDFPIHRKSKNHKDFMPIGLLKIATFMRDQGNQVKLIRGKPKNINEIEELRIFQPEEVWVTSLFTYWARYVRESVQYYKKMFPNVYVKVGGIYASLMHPDEVIHYTGCDEVYQGVIPDVEEYTTTHFPDYGLLGKVNSHPIDFQIIHASRGCLRKCKFCGTWEIEPEFLPKQSIINEINFPHIVFYDNNLLMNPYIENILDELIGLREQGKVKWIESQSGLDGRILIKKPYLARKMKDAGLRYPRIAWDWGIDQGRHIEKQINVLVRAGYNSREIFIFMLYNHNISFVEMEKKRISCWNWKTQIADCRFRPLNQLIDEYNPQVKGQTSKDYFISDGWTDDLVKQFRKNVRRQNICVRMRYPIYSYIAERKRLGKDSLNLLRDLTTLEEKKTYWETLGADPWLPDHITYPDEYYDHGGKSQVLLFKRQ
jgi:hypothetical protein